MISAGQGCKPPALSLGIAHFGPRRVAIPQPYIDESHLSDIGTASDFRMVTCCGVLRSVLHVYVSDCIAATVLRCGYSN
jgi:hypothetical protein